MKKILVICLVACTLIATGCKKNTITTYYSIGCQDYNVSALTDVTGFQSYMEATVDYNKTLQFTSLTPEENDAKARAYFNEQVSKVDAEHACTFIHENEYIVYGVAKQVDNERIIVTQVKYTGNGVSSSR